MINIYKDIKGYEGLYQISKEDATVINVKTGKCKSVWINNKGYKCIDLAKDGVTKHKLLHRIYAETFIPNPNNLPIIMHLDNDKFNISETNLSWGTYSDNNAQAIHDKLKPLPIPDNRKLYCISDGPEVKYAAYGQNAILSEIGYGNAHTVRNALHRGSTIKFGQYAGCKINLLIDKKIDVQRSSPDGRVEPQANGGRKIQLLHRRMQK